MKENITNSIQPTAKHNIFICMGTSCHVRESDQILEQLKKELAIEPGQVTTDGLFYLEVVRCLGACAVGPVLMIDQVLYPNMEPQKVSIILERYRK